MKAYVHTETYNTVDLIVSIYEGTGQTIETGNDGIPVTKATNTIILSVGGDITETDGVLSANTRIAADQILQSAKDLINAIPDPVLNAQLTKDSAYAKVDALDEPSGLTIDNTNPAQFDFQWTNDVLADYYVMQRSQDGFRTFTEDYNGVFVTTLSITTGIVSGQDYNFRLFAINSTSTSLPTYINGSAT